MLVDRFDGIEDDDGQNNIKSSDHIPPNTLTSDLEQLRNDIDAYIDRSTKLNKRLVTSIFRSQNCRSLE